MTRDATSALPVSWPDLQRALQVDGSLRDLIIHSNQERDWQAAFDFTKRLVADGIARIESEPEQLPAVVADIFDLHNTRSAWMHLFVGPLQINCHFFGNPIEFDLDPSQAAAPEGATSLVQFVEGLAQAVGMPVSITEENRPRDVWLTYEPEAHAWARGLMFGKDLGRSRDGGGIFGRLLAWLRGTRQRRRD